MKKLQNEKLKQQFIRSSDYLEQFSFDVSLDTQLFFFPANSYIVKEDHQPTRLFYLVKGKAKLYDTLANGKVALIDFFSHLVLSVRWSSLMKTKLPLVSKQSRTVGA